MLYKAEDYHDSKGKSITSEPENQLRNAIAASIEVVVNVHAGRTTTSEKEARFRSIAANIEEVVQCSLAWSTTNVQTAIAMIDDVVIRQV